MKKNLTIYYHKKGEKEKKIEIRNKLLASFLWVMLLPVLLTLHILFFPINVICKMFNEKPFSTLEWKDWTKKSQAALEFLMIYGWAIIIVLIVIGALAYFGVFSPTRIYCESNPSQCVCEEQETVGYHYNIENCNLKETEDCYIKECSKFRKKTAEELAIDDCNANPREGGDCKCVDWGVKPYREETQCGAKGVEWIDEGRGIYQNFQYFSCTNEDGSCNKQCGGGTIDNSIQANCLSSRPKTEFEKNEILYSCELWRVNFYEAYAPLNHSYLYTDDAINSITSQEVLDDIKSKDCIEYRNKTECEKGQEGWVEETNCLKYNTSTIAKSKDRCENLSTSVTPLGICSIRAYSYSCIENKTICREKTEAEKRFSALMERDCDYLDFSIRRYSSREKADFDNVKMMSNYRILKQAWRAKGCTI